MDGEVLRLVSEKDWNSEAGGLTPKLQNIRELLTPGNINRQDLTQNSSHLHWNQPPPKSQQVPEKDTPW